MKTNNLIIFLMLIWSGLTKFLLIVIGLTLFISLNFILIYGPHAMAVNMGDDAFYGFYLISLTFYGIIFGVAHG